MENQNYFVTELTLAQKKEVSGGFFLGGLLLAVCVAIIADWDNFKNGLSGRPEIAK